MNDRTAFTSRREPNENARYSMVEPSGLGTKAARWGLLAVWIGGVAFGLINFVFQTHPVSAIFAYLCVLASMFFLTTPGTMPLTFARSILTSSLALTAVVVTLCINTELGLGLWCVDIGIYLIALLIVRGNPAVAGTIGALALGAILVWSIVRDVSAADRTQLLVEPLLALLVGVLWLATSHWVGRTSRALHNSAAVAQMQARATEEANSAQDLVLDQIHSGVAPLLNRITQGTELTVSDRLEASVLEAGIRDRLRSPDIATPAVELAAREARLRGVDVVILGIPESLEQSQESASSVNIASVISGIRSGRVTIRRLPAGRDMYATVVVHPADETPSQWHHIPR